MKQFAIYTACIGGYDNVVQPEVIDKRFDYILFTDDVKKQRFGVWQVLPVGYTNADKTRIARYVKTHPHELLYQYKATLWMDANVQIVSRNIYERFIQLYEVGADVASICHPFRNCIYDEAFEVSYSKKYGRLEHDSIAVNWCHYIYNEQYPRHNGLYETNILYRRKIDVVNNANNLWWQCINEYSKRDQLSCNYALWKNQIKMEYFLPAGEHALHSNNVRYLPHDQVSRRKLVNAGFFEQWRYKAMNISNWTLKIGHFIWKKAYSSNRPVSVLKTRGVLLGVFVSPCILYNVIKHRITRLINK